MGIKEAQAGETMAPARAEPASLKVFLDRYAHLIPLADYLRSQSLACQRRSQPLTVAITCKNKSTVLPHVLRRIAEQPIAPDLVLLADDASDDDSTTVFVRSCAALRLDGRVLALNNGAPYRLNTIRNMAFEAAPDGLVCLLDGDLIVSPTYLQRHVMIHAHATVPTASMGPRFEYAHDDLSGPVNFMWGNGTYQQGAGANGRNLPWQAVHGAFVLSRALWQRLGGFDESYDGEYGIDDLDFSFRLFLAGVDFVSDFEAYCIHIPHDTLFADGARDPARNVARFCDKYLVPPGVLRLDIDYSPLDSRDRNWSLDYRAFTQSLLPRDSTVDPGK